MLNTRAEAVVYLCSDRKGIRNTLVGTFKIVICRVGGVCIKITENAVYVYRIFAAVAGMKRRVVISRIGNARLFKALIVIISVYDPSKKYPIITFMSGDGAIEDALDETVGGNESVYLNKSIIEGEDCICIVPYMSGKWLTVPNDTGTVFPYKDYSMSDAKPSIDFEEVRRLLADCIDTLAVDKDRVYFIGYSRGAMAGFYWLADDPDLFAGAILCCGASDPNAAAIYKDTAVWMFIGGSDTKVDVNRFKAIYDAYVAAGGDGKYTEYPGADHSLKYYLANQEGVVEWLFSQTKAK